MNRTRVVAAVAPAVLFTAVASAQIDIDGNGATAQLQESPDAANRFRTVGQVFEVPAPGTETRLVEFEFEFGGAPSGFDYAARVHVFDIDTGRPTGPALYAGPARQANDIGVTTETALSLDLQPGTPYIAFLTTQGVVNDGLTGAIVLANNGNPYAAGSTWRLESASSTDTATAEPWTEIPSFDLDFRAVFEAPDVADLSVRIDDGTEFVSEGESVRFTITIINLGPRNVAGAVVDAPLPSGLADAVWQCLPGSGASCSPSGTGGVADVFDADAGATLSYVVTAEVRNASEAAGIEWIANIVPPSSPTDPNSANNTATDFNAVGLFADGFE